MLAFGKVIEYTEEVTRKVRENGIKKEENYVLWHKIPVRVLMLYQTE